MCGMCHSIISGRRRALDPSVFVRKAGLQVLQNLVRLPSLAAGRDSLIAVLADHCRDSSLAVRKQMVISLTDLLKVRGCSSIYSFYCNTYLPDLPRGGPTGPNLGERRFPINPGRGGQSCGEGA